MQPLLWPNIAPRFTMHLTQVCKTLMYRYISLVISQSRFSNYFTGLVFAGYGEDEICPSLLHVEIDGILNNRLKLAERKTVDIGRGGPVAEIIGFAQDDMVQSFVNGVDPSLRQYSQELLREAVEVSAKLALAGQSRFKSL